MVLPSGEDFNRKFLLAVLADGKIYREYCKKFRVEDISDLRRLSYFGGYYLYSKIIKAIPVNPNDCVLDIGPWTGMECFMLAELYNKVIVAEPDAAIAGLLGSIAEHYYTEDGRLASDVLAIYQMGVGMKGVEPKCCLRHSIKFDTTGSSDINDVLGYNFADRIFCNHIVGVMPKEPKLLVLLSSLASYCSDKAAVTWCDNPAELTYALLEYATFPDDSYALEELCEQLPGDKKHPWVPYMPSAQIKRTIAQMLPDFSIRIRTVTSQGRSLAGTRYLVIAKASQHKTCAQT